MAERRHIWKKYVEELARAMGEKELEKEKEKEATKPAAQPALKEAPEEEPAESPPVECMFDQAELDELNELITNMSSQKEVLAGPPAKKRRGALFVPPGPAARVVACGSS
eukprot:9600608-Lingulodinium_polyedra.AAC.1